MNDNAPVFTSGATASVPENGTRHNWRCHRSRRNALTYSLSGTDAALFDIDAATGAVTFKATPDFEAPGDADADNVYDVVVTASDGLIGIDQAVAITVSNLNDSIPVFTSGASATATENATATSYDAAATDADGDTATFAIAGGADAALFIIDTATGVLSFISAPDFEAGQTSFVVDVRADDGTNSSTQTVTVTLADANDNAPVFTSGASASAAENQTAAFTATATDADAGTTLAYGLSGADAAWFNIDAATGVVTFIALPNFEAPGDTGGDNVYDVVVTASDGSNTTNLNVAITVTDVDPEGPVFTSGNASSVEEGNAAAYAANVVAVGSDVVTYSLSGTDAALFNIDATAGW